MAIKLANIALFWLEGAYANSGARVVTCQRGAHAALTSPNSRQSLVGRPACDQ